MNYIWKVIKEITYAIIRWEVYVNGYVKLDKEYTEPLFERIKNLEFENIPAIFKWSYKRDKHRIT